MGAYGGLAVDKPPGALGIRRRMNIVAIIQSLYVPWALFCSVFWALSFSLHYRQTGLCYALIGVTALFVLYLGGSAFSALKESLQGTPTREPTWAIFMFLTSLLAFAIALFVGDLNFWYNMQPFYDIQNLNTYPAVDPAAMRGQQIMDAGRIFFSPTARLDLTKSTGFKNLDTYCVAPITSGDVPLSTYDFWAVGLNCCSGTSADFHCGEFNNPRARAGLRLMRDDQRPFFRLAVQQAETSHNIRAIHPLFFHWVQDPVAESDAYQDDGYKYYLLGMFSHFAFQLLCVLAAASAFSKAGAGSMSIFE